MSTSVDFEQSYPTAVDADYANRPVASVVLPLPKGRLTGSANAWKKFGTIGFDAYAAFLKGEVVDVELEVIPVYA